VRSDGHEVAFVVILLAISACSEPDEPVTSSLQVTVATAGRDADPDGYRVVVDGDTGTAVSVNGKVVLDGIRVGEHLVSLGDVADNCIVGEDVPVRVVIAQGTAASVTLDVTCAFANTLTFVQNGDIYTTTVTAGAEPRLLASGLTGPSWSPNGDLLCALRPGDAPVLFLIDAEGGGLHQLTGADSNRTVGGCTWKPDGRTIAFDTHRLDNHFPNAQIVRIDVDGSNESSFLADFYQNPRWSPDGTMLAVNILAGPVVIVNDDGTGGELRRIDGCCAEWSPDGTEIVLTGPDFATIQLTTPNSTSVRVLDPAVTGSASSPKWSPDGAKIAYRLAQPGMFPGAVPAVINVDGTGRLVLAPGLQLTSSVDWSFDGEHLAFAAYASQADSIAGQSRLYVVGADGSDLHAVSVLGTVCCFDWRP
jgi:Tol biopolymer transport system component